MSYSNCRLALQQALQGEAGDVAMAFRVLFHRRQCPVLLAEDALARVGDVLAWFGRHPALRWAARLQLALPAPEGRRVPREVFPALPVSALLAGEPGRVIAMQCGTFGPLQKISLLLEKTKTGELVMAKLALGEHADQAVVAEAGWLAKLVASPGLQRGIPKLLGWGHLAGTNRAFLTTTACSAQATKGKTRMDQRHRDFLLGLAKFSRVDGPWAGSECELRTRNRLISAPGIPPAESSLLGQVLDQSSLWIGDGRFPRVLTHGDFAPWNVHLLPDTAYVFDWEYAEECGNPLADFFHFNLMPYATKGKVPGTRILALLLSTAAAHLAEIDGPCKSADKVCRGLLLHYLADTVLFYTEKSGYLGVTHPVISSYLTLMRTRDKWAETDG